MVPLSWLVCLEIWPCGPISDEYVGDPRQSPQTTLEQYDFLCWILSSCYCMSNYRAAILLQKIKETFLKPSWLRLKSIELFCYAITHIPLIFYCLQGLHSWFQLRFCTGAGDQIFQARFSTSEQIFPSIIPKFLKSVLFQMLIWNMIKNYQNRN